MRVVDELNARNEPARKYQSLLVRCNQNGEVSSALYENGQPHPRMKPLRDTILGREYSYSPNGFFQINLPVYEMALREISRHLGDSEKVVDMYAGVGTIGLSVARDRRLVLVETDDNAFREMMNNITQNPDTQTKFPRQRSRTLGHGYCLGNLSSPDFANVAHETFQGTLSRAAREDGERVSDDSRDDGQEERREIVVPETSIKAIHAKSENALDYITHDITLVVDPPRAGLDDRVIARILDVLPPRVIYLSCNPTTQARDVAKLLTKYKITAQKSFNFFPRTPHIENLIILSQ
jgi:tRNA/tmRNA/rRNA uracil-C5-methylase (TrmA/RlmC/RlmD family)